MMKRLIALCMAAWLGLQLGFSVVVSPILFTSDVVNNELATRIMSQLFKVSNGVGLVAWLGAFVASRPREHWGRTSGAVRKWIALLWLGLLVSVAVLNPVVLAYPKHFLVNGVGGSLGDWRGSLHILNVLLAVLGVGLCIRLLRLNTQ